MWSALVVLGVVLWGVGAQAASLPRYAIHDLGEGIVTAVSPDGRIVGMAGNPQVATVFAIGAAPKALGTLPEGTFSQGNDANRLGEVVGYSSTGHLGLQTHAFVWSLRQGMEDLGTLGQEDLFSAATGTNNTATVTGYADAPTGEAIIPVAWIAAQPAPLPTLGGAAGFTDAINDEGTLVGESQIADGTWHATRWSLDGTIHDLHPPQATSSRARGINRFEQIVGLMTTAHGERAWLHTPRRGLRELPPLAGDVGSAALGLNDAGTVVGRSTPPAVGFPPPPTQAVIWVSGYPLELITLLASGADPGGQWALHTAVGISKRGVIAGTGTYAGQRRSWALVPVRGGW